MSAVDGFVWLEFPASGATWRCPADAVEAWLVRGWVRCDEPEPVDLAILERPAPDVPAAAPASKPTRSKSIPDVKE